MDNKEKLYFKQAAVGISGLLFTGTIFYHFQEGLSWLDSFYFTIITLTTVGYGDIYPHTDLGKIFTVFYVIIGIGIVASFINIMTKRRVEKRVKVKEKIKSS
jgi:voltage-gated potassium channel Kch